MSWLFKDPIVTVAWLHFDHTQSNIKKWLEKIKLLQKKFFLKKQLKKISCTSWFLFLSKINKKTWDQIQSEEDTIPFLFQNDQIALNKISFRKAINNISISLLAPFIVQNCKTIQQIQSCEAGCEILGP